LASFSFFSFSNKNLPKSPILHTGGLAFGDTSIRSKPCSYAIFMASFIGKIPSCSPLLPITRTSFALISSFTFVFELLLPFVLIVNP
jgi:hypothetical protein